MKISNAELAAMKLSAAECLAHCRAFGAVVLVIMGDRGWRLYMLNGAAVPARLRAELIDRQWMVMGLLKELAR
jgi:hypothetical protein